MKIRSNIKKNFFKCGNESLGVMVNKNYILKTHKNPNYNYSEHVLLITIILLLSAGILSLLGSKPLLVIGLALTIVAFLYLLFNIIFVIKMYCIRRSTKFKNEIEIDGGGIHDKSYYGIEMTFEWSMVKAIVIRKHTVVVITTAPIYFFFDITKKDDLVDAITKYKKTIPVIE